MDDVVLSPGMGANDTISRGGNPAARGGNPDSRVGANAPDVGANSVPIAPTRLRMRHPGQLYKFENVGLVIALGNVGSMKINFTTAGANKPSELVLPEGNWVLMSVESLEGVVAGSGMAEIHNPYGNQMFTSEKEK